MNFLAIVFLLLGIALVVIGWQGSYNAVWSYLGGNPPQGGTPQTIMSPNTGNGIPPTGMNNAHNNGVTFDMGGQHRVS